MKSEPVLTVGMVSAFVGAVIALVVAFGVKLTDEQRGAILAVIVAAAPIVTAVLARRRVTPNGLVVERVDGDTGHVIAGPANDVIPEGDTIRTRPRRAVDADGDGRPDVTPEG